MQYLVKIEELPFLLSVSVRGWGKEYGAREIGGGRAALRLIRGALEHGRAVRLHYAPQVRGRTVRRIVKIGRKLYTRMEET